MTDIEKKALELVNALGGKWKAHEVDRIGNFDVICALITEHRATKAELEAFKREVSEACNAVCDLGHFGREQVKAFLSRFIIPQPDPLADNLPFVLKLLRYHETGGHEGDGSDHALREARKELEALAARLELVKKEPSQ